MRRQSARTGSKRRFSTGVVKNVSYSFVLQNCVRIVSGITAETYDSKATFKRKLKIAWKSTKVGKKV